jgi:hypothetical protein
MLLACAAVEVEVDVYTPAFTQVSSDLMQEGEQTG